MSDLAAVVPMNLISPMWPCWLQNEGCGMAVKIVNVAFHEKFCLHRPEKVDAEYAQESSSGPRLLALAYGDGARNSPPKLAFQPEIRGDILKSETVQAVSALLGCRGAECTYAPWTARSRETLHRVDVAGSEITLFALKQMKLPIMRSPFKTRSDFGM